MVHVITMVDTLPGDVEKLEQWSKDLPYPCQMREVKLLNFSMYEHDLEDFMYKMSGQRSFMNYCVEGGNHLGLRQKLIRRLLMFSRRFFGLSNVPIPKEHVLHDEIGTRSRILALGTMPDYVSDDHVEHL